VVGLGLGFRVRVRVRRLHYGVNYTTPVCPSVCDVGGSGPHRLEILETNCMDN